LAAVPLTHAGIVGRASRCEPSALLTCVQVLKSGDWAIWMLTTPLVVANEYQYPLTQMMLGSGKFVTSTGPNSARFSSGLAYCVTATGSGWMGEARARWKRGRRGRRSADKEESIAAEGCDEECGV